MSDGRARKVVQKSCISFYEPVHLQEKNYTKNVKLKSIGSRVNCGHNKLANYADVFFIKKTSRATYILKISQNFPIQQWLRISSLAVDCLFFL